MNPVGFVLGCEMVLGRQFYSYIADPTLPTNLPRGKTSTVGVGRWIPVGINKSAINEYSMMSGELRRNPVRNRKFPVKYNEYVIYQHNRVKVRFVFEAEFVKFL